MRKLLSILPVSIFCLVTPLAISPVKAESDTVVEETPEVKVYNAMQKLNSGFKMEGTVNQGVTRTTINGQKTSGSQTYRVVAIFENDEREATELTHYGSIQLPDGSSFETLIDSLVVYNDEDGYAYKEYLNSKNEVERNYLIEDGNKLSYASAGLYNFANYFNPEDFEYDRKFKRYDVDLGKISIILRDLLSHQVTGFLYSPYQATLKMTNDEITTLDVTMQPYYRYTDASGVLTEEKYTNTVKFKFSEIGEAKVPAIEAYEHKEENFELVHAIKNFNDNFTLNISSVISKNGAPDDKKFRTFKADGEQILVQNYNKLSEKDQLTPENHFILKTVEEDGSSKLFSHALVEDKDLGTWEYKKQPTLGFAKSFQGLYSYQDLLPSYTEVSADFFTYDKNVNEYICDDYGILEQINPMFVIAKSPFNDRNILNGYKMGIRVNEKGLIDYVKYYVEYFDQSLGESVTGVVKAEYENVGETSITL